MLNEELRAFSVRNDELRRLRCFASSPRDVPREDERF